MVFLVYYLLISLIFVVGQTFETKFLMLSFLIILKLSVAKFYGFKLI